MLKCYQTNEDIYLVFRFQSLERRPICGGRSVIPSFPEIFRTERLVISLVLTGIHFRELLLTSSILRLLNISLDLGVKISFPTSVRSSDGVLKFSWCETYRQTSRSRLSARINVLRFSIRMCLRCGQYTLDPCRTGYLPTFLGSGVLHELPVVGFPS